jgi:hypothetical protein
MSRSKKKNPFISISQSKSEKQDKVFAHRKERRINRVILTSRDYEYNFKTDKEVSNSYFFSKDGMQRIDPSEYPKGLRK